MNLNELLSDINEYKPSLIGSTEVLGISADNRTIQPGYIFVAVQGAQSDGHNYIKEALKAGAILAISEQARHQGDRILLVASTQEVLGKISQKFYGFPSSQIFCLGVTGTNGKTSTTYMLEHILTSQNIPTGVIGTIDHHFKGRVWNTSHTTPEPVTLQGRLKELRDLGAKALCMEVSSHALAQKRVDGVQFDTVIFTNLSRDHLDYHQDMQQYFLAKQRLFSDLLATSTKPQKSAVINVDDEWAKKIITPAGVSVITYGHSSSHFQFQNIQESFEGTLFDLRCPFGSHKVFIPMVGIHNVYNAVGSLAAAATAGVDLKTAVFSLQNFNGVPGRMQRVTNSKGLHVFVDYAHSPDAMENILQACLRIRKHTHGKNKIWTIFGCGGDRDPGKRPIMGQIAADLSDYVMVTSDNPRTEKPASIISEVFCGIAQERQRQCFQNIDRKRAIKEVFSKASQGDVVLILGKGHEDYQIIGTEKIYFSDIEIAKELLK